MKQYLLLQELDCANCANKIADRLKQLPEITDIEFSFITKKYTLTTSEKLPIDTLTKIIHKIEPDIIVTEIINDATTSPVKHRDKTSCTDEHEHNSHKHSHSHGETNDKFRLPLIIGSIITFLLLIILELPVVIETIGYLLIYALIGYDVLFNAIRNIFNGEWFDESFLMSIATIGAIAIGEYPEAAAVMIFYQVGEYFQDKAVENSRKSITELMDIRPDYANLQIGETTERVNPTTVKTGDIIIVLPGEKIPLDGSIIDGESYIDTSSLTGESVPRAASTGSQVLAGTINTSGKITIVVEKVFADSTVAKIIDLIENASAKKAPTEKFITKFSRYYTPIVVCAAIALATIPTLLFGFDQFIIWLHRALLFLVISCPCALVISVPLGFYAGIGAASKNGILVKGGNYLEALTTVDTILMDKTGTLTKGTFEVVSIEQNDNFTENEVMEAIAYAEHFSNHPIATTIKKANITVDEQAISNYQEIAGYGVTLKRDTQTITVGNSKMMTENKISYTPTVAVGTVIYVAIDNYYAGCVVIADTLKQDAQKTITDLKQKNIKTIMLTGDNENTAKNIATQLGITAYHAELLPQQKVEQVEKVINESAGKVLFVGDGINDAPVLAQADIGIAMGALGSDAAIEAADVVLMTDEPSKIITAINIGKKTKMIVTQNIIFAIGVKLLVLLLGAFGIASMWAAVFADIGVSILAILNSLRILRYNGEQ